MHVCLYVSSGDRQGISGNAREHTRTHGKHRQTDTQHTQHTHTHTHTHRHTKMKAPDGRGREHRHLRGTRRVVQLQAKGGLACMTHACWSTHSCATQTDPTCYRMPSGAVSGSGICEVGLTLYPPTLHLVCTLRQINRHCHLHNMHKHSHTLHGSTCS